MSPMAAMAAELRPLLCTSHTSFLEPCNSKPSLFAYHRYRLPHLMRNEFSDFRRRSRSSIQILSTVNGMEFRGFVCGAVRGRNSKRRERDDETKGEEGEELKRKVVKNGLWVMEGVYILWLFLLPYAPGDPVWAISSDTINSLVDLSLNFFFILAFTNALGIHVLDAPVLHPMSEGLFNFVIGWTLMFAPLLFTDHKRDRYKGSLAVLWGFQMFLTNTFLIPYMAIRLNKSESGLSTRKQSQLGAVMTNGASIVGLIGGAVCLISIFWALFGRTGANFGSITDRLEFLMSYLGSERLAYAFIWDIVLYTIFQPWLIGDNLQNVEKSKADTVNSLRFIPVVGLVAYLFCLDREGDPYTV